MSEKVKKPFYKKWWVWLVAVIVVVAVSSGGSGDTTPTGDAVKTSASSKKGSEQGNNEEKAKTYNVGETATVANVAFTVTDVKVKQKIESGNQFVEPAKASGKYVILDVKIKNGQKEALTIMESYFKIKTDDGTTYEPSTDTDLMMVLDPENKFFLEQINPGITKSGVIVFDVPKSLKLKNVYLHGKTGFWGTETINISLKK